MTKQQVKICKIILRYKTLNKILQKANLEDWEELQMSFKPWMLEESDPDEKGNTVITLNNKLLEEFENRRNELFYKRIPLILSIVALIVSIFSINSNSLLWNCINFIAQIIRQL